jgi:hypothetical protein
MIQYSGFKAYGILITEGQKYRHECQQNQAYGPITSMFHPILLFPIIGE